MVAVDFLFVGMRGFLSLAALAALLKHGRRPVAVMVDRPAASSTPPQRLLWTPPAGSTLPLRPSAAQESIVSLAQRHGLPVYDVGDPAAAAPLLQELAPDFVVVTCFPRRLPPLWWEPRPCLNLHPSLLPAYRGPAPLFWQFRHAEEEMGVTVHLLDEGLDSGDIVAQSPLEVPAGALTEEVEQKMAERGVELLLDAVVRRPLPRRAQEPAAASYFPQPAAADRRLSQQWSARRTCNFIRGARAWGPFFLEDGRAVADARPVGEGEKPAGWHTVFFADAPLWLAPA